MARLSRPGYLGDDLYVCQAMLDAGGDFLLTAKPSVHRNLYEPNSRPLGQNENC